MIDQISKGADRNYVDFPRINIKPGGSFLEGLDHEMCTSFSGLKTALMYYLRDNPLEAGDAKRTADIAASFQEAVIDALEVRAEKAVEGVKYFVVGGGVSLNSRLRERLTDLAARKGVELLLAIPKHCGDNAAMIAGYAGAGKGITGEEAMIIDATPNINYALGI